MNAIQARVLRSRQQEQYLIAAYTAREEGDTHASEKHDQAAERPRRKPSAIGLAAVREQLSTDIEAERVRILPWKIDDREHVRRAVCKSAAPTSALAAITGIPARTIRYWRGAIHADVPSECEDEHDHSPVQPTRDLFPGGIELIRRQLKEGAARRTWRELVIIDPAYGPLVPKMHVVEPRDERVSGHPRNIAFVSAWRTSSEAFRSASESYVTDDWRSQMNPHSTERGVRSTHDDGSVADTECHASADRIEDRSR